jgi:hypothetical protein
MKERLTKSSEDFTHYTKEPSANSAENTETIISLGNAAWRVLQNARKAAIARRNDEDAERRGLVFKVPAKRPATARQHAAPSVVGFRAELERTREKRPTNSGIGD